MLKEKKFQTKFRHWLQANWHGSAAFELKVAKTALPFNAVKPHQRVALQTAKTGKLIWKIADDSLGAKPMDIFVLDRTPAFVVVVFCNAKNNFYLIDIDVFLKLEKTSKRKSLTEKIATDICSYSSKRSSF